MSITSNPKSTSCDTRGAMLDDRPIAQHRFGEITDATIRFSFKDKRLRMRVSAEYSPADFVALLAEHVPDRYRHAVRYFGLLAPRSKARTTTAIFLLLGQRRRPRPRRLGWAYSIRRDFGNDPLIDSLAQPMRWVGRLSPTTPNAMSCSKSNAASREP
jgi:hypothetical protein